MKTLKLINFFFCIFFLAACSNDEKDGPDIPDIPDIPVDIDTDLADFPVIDASTSTAPLQTMLACKILGYNYEWMQAWHLNGTYYVQPDYDDIPDRDMYWDKIKTSGTHEAIINLIDKKADLILVARKMSDEEKKHADNAGIKIIETPIALDALVFIANTENSVKRLTSQQIQNIYQGYLVNWNEVGGNNKEIKPYTRNANSGSQELMESLVMKDKKIKEWPELMISSMIRIFGEIIREPAGLAYTVHYYKEYIVREDEVKSLAVDGIYPDKETIADRSYPYTAEVYVSIRADIDKSSTAYKIYELLQGEVGKQIIEESGYVPYK